MCNVGEPSFRIEIFAFIESSGVAEAGTHKSRIINTISPIVGGIFPGPISQHFPHLEKSIPRDELKRDFLVIEF